MANPIAKAFVDILPNSSNFSKALEDQLAPAIEEVEQKSEELADTVDKSMNTAGDSVDKLRGRATLLATAVVGAIGLMGKAAVSQASALNESTNAVNVTFGAAAEGIRELAENSAKAVGMSTAQFNQLSVQFSSFANTIAGPGGDVVKVIEEMTVRAADFASVMDLEVADAARIFQSGLAGETEPLKRFGLDLSEAAVKSYAYANGIAVAGSEMTEQQKVLARYGALMDQTSKTQGDFANTADSYANATRTAKAELANAQAEIGTALLPILGRLVSMLADVAGWMAQNSGFVLALATAAGTLALAVIAVNTAITLWKTLTTVTAALNKMLEASFLGLSGSVTRLQVAMGGIGLILAAATTVYGLYTATKDKATTATNSFTDALNAEGDAQVQALRDLYKTDAGVKALIDSATSLGFTIDDVTTYLRTGGGRLQTYEGLIKAVATANFDNLIPATREFATALGYTGQLTDDSLGKFAGLANMIYRTRDAMIATAKETAFLNVILPETGQKVTTELPKVSRGVSKVRQEIERLRDAMRDQLTDAVDKARDALKSAEKGFRDFATSVKESISGSINFTQAYEAGQETGEGFLAGLRDQAEKARGFSERVNRLLSMGISEAGLQQVLSAGVDAGTKIADELIAGGAAAITGPDGVNALLAATDVAAQRVGVNAAGSFRAAGVATAQALVAGIESVVSQYRLTLKSQKLTKKQIQKLQRDFGVEVNLQFASANIPQMANGGIVTGRTVAMIGEAGAEAVIPMTRPARAMQIMEQTGLASLARGAGSATVRIESATFVAPVDADLIAQKVNAAELARSFST